MIRYALFFSCLLISTGCVTQEVKYNDLQTVVKERQKVGLGRLYYRGSDEVFHYIHQEGAGATFEFLPKYYKIKREELNIKKDKLKKYSKKEWSLPLADCVDKKDAEFINKYIPKRRSNEDIEKEIGAFEDQRRLRMERAKLKDKP